MSCLLFVNAVGIVLRVPEFQHHAKAHVALPARFADVSEIFHRQRGRSGILPRTTGEPAAFRAILLIAIRAKLRDVSRQIKNAQRVWFETSDGRRSRKSIGI